MVFQFFIYQADEFYINFDIKAIKYGLKCTISLNLMQTCQHFFSVLFYLKKLNFKNV